MFIEFIIVENVYKIIIVKNVYKIYKIIIVKNVYKNYIRWGCL